MSADGPIRNPDHIRRLLLKYLKIFTIFRPPDMVAFPPYEGRREVLPLGVEDRGSAGLPGSGQPASRLRGILPVDRVLPAVLCRRGGRNARTPAMASSGSCRTPLTSTGRRGDSANRRRRPACGVTRRFEMACAVSCARPLARGTACPGVRGRSGLPARQRGLPHGAPACAGTSGRWCRGRRPHPG